MDQQPPQQPSEEQPTVPQSQPFPPPSQPFPPVSQPFPQPPSQPFPPTASQPLPYPSQPLPYPSQPLPQMPPPGYYPPGPGYPQMPPPPPKRSRRTLWIVVGVVVLVVLVACIGGIAAIANGGKNTSNTTTNGTTPAATSQTGTTPTTAPSSGDLKVGDTATFNNEWQVTINSVSLSSGDPSKFDPTPDANMTYLVVEGTFKNIQSKAQPLSTLLFFELRDSQGNRYDETLLLSVTPPDGESIPAGGLAHGKWPYEVPTSAHSFTLSFNADLVGDSIIWDINV